MLIDALTLSFKKNRRAEFILVSSWLLLCKRRRRTATVDYKANRSILIAWPWLVIEPTVLSLLSMKSSTFHIWSFEICAAYLVTNVHACSLALFLHNSAAVTENLNLKEMSEDRNPIENNYLVPDETFGTSEVWLTKFRKAVNWN